VPGRIVAAAEDKGNCKASNLNLPHNSESRSSHCRFFRTRGQRLTEESNRPDGSGEGIRGRQLDGRGSFTISAPTTNIFSLVDAECYRGRKCGRRKDTQDWRSGSRTASGSDRACRNRRRCLEVLDLQNDKLSSRDTLPGAALYLSMLFS
jgi:hypothetical protein